MYVKEVFDAKTLITPNKPCTKIVVVIIDLELLVLIYRWVTLWTFLTTKAQNRNLRSKYSITNNYLYIFSYFLKKLSPSLDETTQLGRYGWVVSANPLGQTLAAPLFGWFYQKTGSARIVGVITSLVYIVGNILYSTLSVFPQDSRYWLLLASRFIVGVCSGKVISKQFTGTSKFTIKLII